MEVEFEKTTGAQLTSDKNWIIETDGVCLSKILGKEKVDHRKTVIMSEMLAVGSPSYSSYSRPEWN